MPKLSLLQKLARSLSPEDRVEVQNSIKSWVSAGRVNDRIILTPVDEKRLRENKKALHHEAERKLTYEKFGLKRYTSREEFFKSIEPYENNITTGQREAMWANYQHRDKLIRSGQYEEIRIDMFKENYIKAMEGKGHSKELIDIINSLNYSQLRELIRLPGDKNSDENKKLPSIGNYSYKTQGVMDSQGLAEEEEAIEEALFLVTGNSSYLSFLKKYGGDKYIKDEDTYLEEEIDYYTENIKDKYKDKIRVNKKGKMYIRGIGSEDGKNSKIFWKIYDIIED